MQSTAVCSHELRQLLGPRPSRQPLPHLCRERRPVQPPARQSPSSRTSASRRPSTSSGATTTTRSGLANQVGGRASGGTAARMGRSAARYSNTFAESTAARARQTRG